MTVFGCMKSWLRRRVLRPITKDATSMILPLSRIRTAVAFIDAEDSSWEEGKNALQAFFRVHGIKGEIFFFDLRKIEKGERLITSPNTMVRRSDLNWLGKPGEDKVRCLMEAHPDLLVSLIDSSVFPLTYMAARSDAKFKVGRRQLPGNVFDIVISDPAEKRLSQAEAFAAITDFIGKIQ